ncbi:MAG: lipopolysaccharide transport periplasmic protein LptA [Halieaceae bacterium]
MNFSRYASFKRRSGSTYNAAMPLSPAILCLFFSALLLPPGAVALPEDKEQPIRIKTDRAVRDEKTGLTVYTGDVELVQGTIRITADRVTVYKIEEEGDKIVAEGSPARMQQQRQPDSALTHAKGRIIEYYRNEGRVQLRENAQVEEDGSTVRGDKIDYFIDQQLVKAAADESEAGRRVEVVIPPSKSQQ